VLSVSSDQSRVQAFLIDLDGVLYVGKNPIPGVKECLERMDELGYGYRFVSNSTRRCRRSVAERLRGLGYDVQANHIFTPSLAAIDLMKSTKREKCYLLTTGDVQKDFEDSGIKICQEDADYVVIGDAADGFTFERLNHALRLVLDGAEILALEKDRYWKEPGGLVLSAGPFVAALEYATGKKAELMGKPSSKFFQMALDDLRIMPGEAAMIGDDILTDVGGAQEMGMKGILVKTGKYREQAARGCSVYPDMVIESLAHLADHLQETFMNQPFLRGIKVN
jgi:HAD superfamily hydrolase (TIGR01458 family)